MIRVGVPSFRFHARLSTIPTPQGGGVSVNDKQQSRKCNAYCSNLKRPRGTLALREFISLDLAERVRGRTDFLFLLKVMRK